MAKYKANNMNRPSRNSNCIYNIGTPGSSIKIAGSILIGSLLLQSNIQGIQAAQQRQTIDHKQNNQIQAHIHAHDNKLPGQDDFIDTQAEQGEQNLVIETESLGKDGKIDVGSLLNMKLEQDQKRVGEVPSSKLPTSPLAQAQVSAQVNGQQKKDNADQKESLISLDQLLNQKLMDDVPKDDAKAKNETQPAKTAMVAKTSETLASLAQRSNQKIITDTIEKNKQKAVNETQQVKTDAKNQESLASLDQLLNQKLLGDTSDQKETPKPALNESKPANAAAQQSLVSLDRQIQNQKNTSSEKKAALNSKNEPKQTKNETKSLSQAAPVSLNKTTNATAPVLAATSSINTKTNKTEAAKASAPTPAVAASLSQENKKAEGAKKSEAPKDEDIGLEADLTAANALWEKAQSTVKEGEKALMNSSTKVESQAKLLADLNEQAERKLKEQARLIATAKAEAKKRKEQLEKERKLAEQKAKEEARKKKEKEEKEKKLAKEKADAEAKRRIEEARIRLIQEEEKEREIAEKNAIEEKLAAEQKAQRIQKYKEEFAMKLEKAAEEKRRELLSVEAKKQAADLAKKKAAEMAQMKAQEIAEQILAQQEEQERARLAKEQQELQLKEQAERSERIREAQEERRRRKTEEQQRKLAEEKEQQRAEQEQTEREEREKADKEQEEKDAELKAAQAKEEAEAEQSGDIGEMLSQFKQSKSGSKLGISANDATNLVEEADKALEKNQNNLQLSSQINYDEIQHEANYRPNDQIALQEQLERKHHHHHKKPRPDDDEVQIDTQHQTSVETQKLLDEANQVLHTSKSMRAESPEIARNAEPQVLQTAVKDKILAAKAEAKPYVLMTAPKKVDLVYEQKQECPKPKECPKCQQAQVQPAVQLSQEGSKEFEFQSDSSDAINPEKLDFKILPKNYRDTVHSIDVIDSSRILGFNTYNNILTQQRQTDIEDRDSDFYNVTLNLVVRRMPQFVADQKLQKKPNAPTDAPEDKKADSSQNIEISQEDLDMKSVVLTQMDLEDKNSIELQNQAEKKKHRVHKRKTITADQFDEFPVLAQKSQKKHHVVKKPAHISPPKQKLITHVVDSKNIDDVFNKIQDEDMKQEQFIDERVSGVIQAQQRALKDENDDDEEEDAPKPIKKEKLSDAEIQAQNLAHSLENQKIQEEQIERQGTEEQKERGDYNALEDAINSQFKKGEHGYELINEQSDVHLKELSHGTMTLSHQTVANIQAKLEAKVQKELDQLTIIANNEYADGNHVYDYQLVRLSDKQKEEEKKAIEQANELQLKHTNLKRAEERLSQKFERAKARLNEYKTKFYKNQKTLQQDHDTYVKIKDQTQKELKEQIDMQEQTELTINKALQEKIDFLLKEKSNKAQAQDSNDKISHNIQERGKQLAEAQQTVQDKIAQSTKQALQQQQKYENEYKKKLAAEQKEYLLKKKQLEADMKAQAEKLAQEKAKQLEMQKEKVRLEEEAKNKAKVEIEMRAKLEAEYKARMEKEFKQKEEQMAKDRKAAEAKAQAENKARLEAVNDAKKRAEEKQKEIALAEDKAKKEAQEQEQLEQKAQKEADDLERQEKLVKEKAKKQLQKKKKAAEKAKLDLKHKQKALAAAQKEQEDDQERLKAEHERQVQAIHKDTEEKRIKLAAISQQKAEEEAKIQLKAQEEAKKKAEQLELEKALAEAKLAEEAHKKAEQEAKEQVEAMKKAQAIENAKKEAEIKQKEQEAAQKAKEEAERKAKAEAELKEKEEQERKRREREREAEEKRLEEAKLRAKLEAEKKVKEESERIAQEEKAKLEAEKKKLENDRKVFELSKKQVDLQLTKKQNEKGQSKLDESSPVLQLSKQKTIDDRFAEQKAKTMETTQQLKELESEPFFNQQQVMVEQESHVHQELEAREQARAKAKAKAEKEALQKVAAAALAGIRQGEEASRKLHQDAKVQTEEQTRIAVEKLKDKFDSTKQQVLAIVQNFGKIHSDLQQLKQEYAQDLREQEQGQSSNYVQLDESAFDFTDDAKVQDIKNRLNAKNEEIQEMVHSFQKMHTDLSSIKNQFELDKKNSQLKLVQMKNQEAETKLSKLFQHESMEMMKDTKKDKEPLSGGEATNVQKQLNKNIQKHLG